MIADAMSGSNQAIPAAVDWIVPESCPLCGSPAEEHALFDSIAWQSRALVYLVCRRCGLVFQSPRPTREWLERFYETAYHASAHGQADPVPMTAWVETLRAEHFVNYAGEHIDKVRSHLDLGSSLGKLLLAVREAYGSEAVGVEPAAAFREISIQRGLAVTSRLAELGTERQHTFDLVTLSHVLEHMTDPVGTLRRLRRDWMTDAGHVMIEVPNLFSHLSLELAHLTAFTADSLRRALRLAGFELLDLRTHGHPYSRRLPFYIQAIARTGRDTSEDPGPRPSVFGIRFRRWAGLLRLRTVWAVTSRWQGRGVKAPPV